MYTKESTVSWNIQSVYQKKSWFAWTGAARNLKVMMTFLLFEPASTKWLGWRTLILFCVTCYHWHSVEQMFWKLWTNRHSLSADEVIRRRVCQTRVHKSLIGNLAKHSFSLSDRNKDSAPNKQDEWTTASFSLTERWTITEIRRQSNSVLTYSLLTDVLPV